jgi:hypothetical protein
MCFLRLLRPKVTQKYLPKPRFWFVLLPFGPAEIFQLQINNMQQVKKGDTVKVHYHGKLTNGSTFDSSEGREPLKFEVRVFSKKWKIAGMIDALFLYRGKIFIVDYKTNKKFTTDENIEFVEKLLPPFDGFKKTHLNEYSIQLSLYALILKEWGFEIGGAYLVHIGPGDDDAKLHKCVDMMKILEKYLNESLIS